jgi:hypothetical protein
MSRLDSLKTEDFLREHPDIPASGDCLLILVEGEKTEVNYFEKVCGRLGLTGADVKTVFAGSDPGNMVKEAVELRNERENQAVRRQAVAYADVWCVFDTENVDHRRRPRMLAACKLAREKNINLALSAPTFEVWLLLHTHGIDLSWTTSEQAEDAMGANYKKGTFDCSPLLQYSTKARERARIRRNAVAPQDTGHWGKQVTAWFADGRPQQELAKAIPVTDVDLLLDILNLKAVPNKRSYPPTFK